MKNLYREVVIMTEPEHDKLLSLSKKHKLAKSKVFREVLMGNLSTLQGCNT